MKKMIKNKHNLKDWEITNIVTRVKIIIINSKKELLLGYSHNQYQFIGGHVEENEELIEAINREVKEETGIILNKKDIVPKAVNIGYWKDWPAKGENRKTIIYYYEINSDEKINKDLTSYTDDEKDGNFELVYIPIKSLREELTTNYLINDNAKGITNEMFEVLELLKIIEKGDK